MLQGMGRLLAGGQRCTSTLKASLGDASVVPAVLFFPQMVNNLFM